MSDNYYNNNNNNNNTPLYKNLKMDEEDYNFKESFKIAAKEAMSKKAELDIKSWWCKLTDHTCFTNDQKREILSKYVIGDVLSFIRPDYILPEVPKTLRIAMCGATGAGKSSLACTIKTASIKDAAVLGWITNVGQGDQQNPMPTQLGGEQHVFEIGKKNEEQMLIELVDNRGWLNNATKETMNIIEGKIATNTPVEREGDPIQDYVQHFKSSFPQKAERYHLCILVIPSDLPIDKADNYIELRNLIKMTRIPVLHIFTKLDLPNAKANVNALKAKLNLGEYDALELTCYNTPKGGPRAVVNEEINSQALFALLWAIVIADSKGLPISNEKQLHIAQREVAKLVSTTTAIVKQKAGQESKLMYGLLLIILLLVVNIFVRF